MEDLFIISFQFNSHSSQAQMSARAVPRYPWPIWVPLGTRYRENLRNWVPLGTGYRANFKRWVTLGTGYRANFRSWVPMGTGYRPEKKFWVPKGTGYRPEKKFGYQGVPGTGKIFTYADPWSYSNGWHLIRRAIGYSRIIIASKPSSFAVKNITY